MNLYYICSKNEGALIYSCCQKKAKKEFRKLIGEKVLSLNLVKNIQI